MWTYFVLVFLLWDVDADELTYQMTAGNYPPNVDEIYGDWSEWSQCERTQCIERRIRECRESSFVKPIRNSLLYSTCPYQFIVEYRRCIDPSLCLFSDTSSIINTFADTCGIRYALPPQTMTKIFGGQTSTPHSWPWVAGLYFDAVWMRKHRRVEHPFCGASLVAPRHLVTAAHCISNLSAQFPLGRPFRFADFLPFSIKARLGDHSRVRHEPWQVDIPVETATIHERYRPDKPHYGYDVAILTLANSPYLSQAIYPVCVPTFNTELPQGTKCYAAGWGNTRPVVKKKGSRTARSNPLNLLEVDLRLASFAKCSLYINRLIKGVHICAGEPGKDTCTGDSGGGLFCQNPANGRWLLYGVTSFGSARGCGHYASVYTSIPGVSKWIHNNVR
uniref:Peptidase S1 domain-containing protein n=1 Tax=Mesocestoides corti TaxID=53468 RepID=A0A5K3FBJ5_MESCO